MENEARSRRAFLKQLGYLLSAGCAGNLLEPLASQSASTSKASKGKEKILAGHYKVSTWTGDDFSLGHRLRTGQTPAIPDKAEKSVDFVIVGGGIAGLTTAFYLKDQDFLLLDQFHELGGQSRGGSFRGIDYSFGPAYINAIDGIYGQLYGDLGITPAKLAKGDNSWFWDGHWYANVHGPDKAVIYRDFKRLSNEALRATKELPDDDSAEALSGGNYSKLDALPFAANLSGYSPQFISLIDNVCKSAFCGDTRQLNSLAGYWLIDDLDSQNYCFEGGNPAIARALVSKLKQSGEERLLPQTFVWKIQLHDGGASVVYGTTDGTIHRVDCKQVVIATPPLVTARIVENLDDLTRASLLGFKYGSYFVANCLMSKKLFNGTYDNWFCTPFTFSDIVIAETPYMVSDRYKPEMGSVLTVYQPYTPGSPGRALLLEGNRQKFASSTYNQLTPLIEHLDRHLEEIVLSRWGHAMVVAGPGFFSKLSKLQKATRDAPFTLAHNSSQGLPSAESAIRAARAAADKVLAKPTKISLLVT